MKAILTSAFVEIWACRLSRSDGQTSAGPQNTSEVRFITISKTGSILEKVRMDLTPTLQGHSHDAAKTRFSRV
jgi:hypothetical protein